MSQKVTLQDLARQLGVTASTVSRALAGRSGVAPETRAKIAAVAARLGYVPDPAAADLGSRRARTHPAHPAWRIALIIGTDESTPPADPRTQALIGAFREACAAAGYDCEITTSSAHGSPAALSRVLWQRGARGLVWIRVQPAHLQRFDHSLFSSVFLDRESLDLGHDSAGASWDQRFLAAVQGAEARGARSLGFVLHRDSDPTTRRLCRAHALYHREHCASRLGAQPSLFEVPLAAGAEKRPDAWARSRAELRDWFRDEQPDTIITDCPYSWPLLEQARIAVPREAGFLLLRDIHVSDTIDVACVRPAPTDLMHIAVEVLHHKLLHGLFGVPAFPQHHAVPATLHAGQTLRNLSPISPLPHA